MKKYLFLSLLIILSACNQSEKQGFKIAFLTDIHLNDNPASKQGLELAISEAKAEGIDFIMTGGDNVDIDILGSDSTKADSRFQKLAGIFSDSEIKFYPTMGNHDRFWGTDSLNNLYNEGLFEKYIHKSYYSFDYKGWHFIVLNSTQTSGGKYCVGTEQKQWLKNDLNKVNENTPIVVSAHVPFLSVYYPALEGRYTDADTFSNFKEIWDMFDGKNLKLVLQGHQHLYEEIQTRGVQFITAGAVSAKWWGGAYHGTEEGFLLLNFTNDDFNWEYIDYGWEVKNH